MLLLLLALRKMCLTEATPHVRYEPAQLQK